MAAWPEFSEEWELAKLYLLIQVIICLWQVSLLIFISSRWLVNIVSLQMIIYLHLSKFWPFNNSVQTKIYNRFRNNLLSYEKLLYVLINGRRLHLHGRTSLSTEPGNLYA